jgi:hypothetical protein
LINKKKGSTFLKHYLDYYKNETNCSGGGDGGGSNCGVDKAFPILFIKSPINVWRSFLVITFVIAFLISLLIAYLIVYHIFLSISI